MCKSVKPFWLKNHVHNIFGRATKGNFFPSGETLRRVMKVTSISINQRSAFFVGYKLPSSFISGVTAPVHTSGGAGLANFNTG